MADIELVIRVSEKDIDFIKKYYKPTGYDVIPRCIINGFVSAILNGTQIPKGHGKLIDVNTIIYDYFMYPEKNKLPRHAVSKDKIDAMPAIIEADKE